MDLVLDANIFFAAIVKRSITADLLFREDFHLYAPEFLFEEFEKYKVLLKGKTERSNEEFDLFLGILQRKITLVPYEDIAPFIEKAKDISPDIKDIAYVALALWLNCAIWSNDKALKEKQDIIKVYPTHELVRL